MVVPGLYGYVSAMKWATDINVTKLPGIRLLGAARLVAAGADQHRMPDRRADGATDIQAGQTAIACVAWVEHKGIDAVHVRVDQGPWNQAKLAAVPGIDSWRQWVWHGEATGGNHVIEAQATDATGYTQTSFAAQPKPNGASGYPMVTVTVA